MNVDHGSRRVTRMATTQKDGNGQPSPSRCPTIWEIPDDLWERILPILEKFWPRKPTGRHHANWRWSSTGSSSGCVPVASGTSCPASSAPRAPSTTGSSAGVPAAS